MLSITNKKGAGVPISIFVIILATLILVSTTLFYFNVRDNELNLNLYSTSSLEGVYAKQEIIDFQIQNLVDSSYDFGMDEQEFLNEFKGNLELLKNKQGEFIFSELNDVEKQLILENVEIISGRVNLELNVKLSGEISDQNKVIFDVEYIYDKTYSNKV